jgi:hypothetical protein
VISTIIATTLAGWTAKADALLDGIDVMEDGRPFEEGLAMGHSLLQDLLQAARA